MSSLELVYFTRPECAKILRVSVRTIDNHLASGRLRSVKFGHRRLIEKNVLLNIADSAAREQLGV